MLCPLLTDLIAFKVEFSERLCEKSRWLTERSLEKRVNRVVCESSGDIFCPLVSNLIVFNVECSECLLRRREYLHDVN
jgi:hypothetical protein